MNSAKRGLKPVRLAIPTLLALSVTAAWTPFESVSGTGFSADEVTTSTASLTVTYHRIGFPLDLWTSAQWRDSSTGQWQWLNPGGQPTLWDNKDDWPVQWTGITKPPVDKAILWLWDDNDTGNYALAEVSDP